MCSLLTMQGKKGIPLPCTLSNCKSASHILSLSLSPHHVLWQWAEAGTDFQKQKAHGLCWQGGRDDRKGEHWIQDVWLAHSP